MRVVLAPLAASDLEEAYRYLSQTGGLGADRLLLRVSETLGLLSSGLDIGRWVTLRDGRRVQSWPMPPYRIFYRLTGEELQVVRIYHQARRPLERQPRRKPREPET